MLQQPDFTRKFRVETDASDFQLGAALTQQDDNGWWRPLEYYSRRLTTAELNARDCPTYLEAIAVYEACKRWRQCLIDASLDILSDHAPLTSLPTRKSSTDRLTRVQIAMQSFRYTVLYQQGAENILPDALSRIVQIDAKPGPDPGAGEEDLPTRSLAPHLRKCHELEKREGIGASEGALPPEYVRAAEVPGAESAETSGGLTLAYALNPTNCSLTNSSPVSVKWNA